MADDFEKRAREQAKLEAHRYWWRWDRLTCVFRAGAIWGSDVVRAEMQAEIDDAKERAMEASKVAAFEVVRRIDYIKEIERLKAELQSARSFIDSRVIYEKKLNDEIERLKQVERDLQHEMRMQHAVIGRHTAQIIAGHEEIKRLKAELETQFKLHQVELGKLDAELKRAQAEQTRLVTQILSQIEAIDRANAQIDLEKNRKNLMVPAIEMKNLFSEIERLKAELADAKAEYAYYNDSVNVLHAERIKSLETELAEAKSERAKAGEGSVLEIHDYQELKAELNRVKEVCMDLNREKNTTFDQSCKNRAEADELKAELERAKGEVEKLKFYESVTFDQLKKIQSLELMAESYRATLAKLLDALVRQYGQAKTDETVRYLDQAVEQARAALDEVSK